LKFLHFNWIFFVFLVSVTAAKVVEMSRRDSSTVSRLAYFDEVYLTRHGHFFSFRSRFIYWKSPQVTFLTESRLQVDFQSVLVQVKSVSTSKVTPRSDAYGPCTFFTFIHHPAQMVYLN